MRGSFYIPCLEKFKKMKEIAAGVLTPLFMSEYPISFNSFKNVTWYANTTNEVDAIVAAQRRARLL